MCVSCKEYNNLNASSGYVETYAYHINDDLDLNFIATEIVPNRMDASGMPFASTAPRFSFPCAADKDAFKIFFVPFLHEGLKDTCLWLWNR